MKMLLIILSASLVVGSAAAQNKVSTIDDLRFMAGCWEQKNEVKKLLISEMWMAPAGTSILGMGRTVKSGKTTGWEYMRIELRVDGIYFVSRPHENTEDTSFKLISSSAADLVFENKAHDFPQRVIYKRNGDTLTGRIEGTENGKFIGIDFPMTRVKCG